ncbi:PQQ-binding-like beta-propeller repeat protein [Pseudooctadecabacter jejudonensis]|uniref:Uncharacterized protein n=1 Tax=Pseudooctadecabacter jejudonensis TaxID=1391910 RepID=A0A1Y5SXB9_9RHOB|nr:hypothetical protein [Pseudooctadecabacter jejudonensis]SLN47296.1 hypothetical protein PSJ8397_02479 [Pseudooctadecabacter jejudonensis]
MQVIAMACLGLVCALPLAAQENLGIYQNTATAFEHGDAGRSHTFGEAIFAEDMSETADYSVKVREAMGRYPGAYNIVTRAADEIFVYYGVYGDVDASTGPTVAKLNSDTFDEVWNTQIAAFGVEKWNYPGVLSLHGNGRLYAVGGDILAMLDPDTGAILQQTELPSSKPNDVSYNGFITTSDGMLFVKPLDRTCPERGGQALLKCPDAETPTVFDQPHLSGPV